MIVSAIVAMAENRVIGKDGTLPWKIPEDTKFFRDKTMGHIMLMGRKTFESFGKLLPGRLHVVVSRQKSYQPVGAHVFQSCDEALQFCKTQTAKWGDEVFLVGGGELYRELLSVTDRIYLTEIHLPFEGDARFPEFDKKVFIETERLKRTEPVPFDFVTYHRK
jgi:dihydrofolate reductase